MFEVADLEKDTSINKNGVMSNGIFKEIKQMSEVSIPPTVAETDQQHTSTEKGQGKFSLFKFLDNDKTMSDLSNDQNMEEEIKNWQMLQHDTELTNTNLKRNLKFQDKLGLPLNLNNYHPLNELLEPAFIQQIINENPRIRPNWMVKIISGD